MGETFCGGVMWAWGPLPMDSLSEERSSGMIKNSQGVHVGCGRVSGRHRKLGLGMKGKVVHATLVPCEGPAATCR